MTCKLDNRKPQSDQVFQNCVGLDIYMEMTSIIDSGTKKYGTVIMEPKTMEVFYRLLDKLLTELGGTLMIVVGAGGDNGADFGNTKT